MATVAARGSGTPATTGTTWATTTNAVDGAAGTNPATYATLTSAVSGAVATIEITGYGFSTTVGSADTLNSVTVSLRHFENNTGRFASVTFQAFDGATAIGTATTATLATAARNDVATPAVTLAQLRSSTFKIRVTITGAASTQSRIFSIDQVDVTADYTPLPPAITQAAYGFYADGTETGATAYTTTATPTADSYADTNADSALSMATASGPGAQAQSFLGNGQNLTRAGFYLTRVGSPPGTLTAYLYAHDGATFGTTGKPTGSPLATSTTTLTSTSVALGPTLAWYYFDFDGTYTLTKGTAFFVAVAASTNLVSANRVSVGLDTVSPTHPGNQATYNGTTWGNFGGADLVFEISTVGYVVDTSAGDVNLQVRTRLQSTNAAPPTATDDWQLQWEKNTSGTWNAVTSTAIVDSYNGTADYQINLVTAGESYGQSFLGNGQNLSQFAVWGRYRGSPPGTMTAVLYAHSGTFGTSSVGTGTALATSTAINATTAFGTTDAWAYFTFDGTFTLANGTAYVLLVSHASTFTTSTADVVLYADGSAPTHAGNWVGRSSGGSWTADNTSDLLFQILTTAPTTAVPYASANLTDGAATTNRLGAGTGTFVAGEISETGLVTDLGWTANNYTELLYSVTLKQADLSPADTLRFRVLRNAATTGMTYTAYPSITIGSGAPVDRTGVAAASLAVAGTAAGVRDTLGVATATLTVAGTASGSPAAAPVLGTATAALTVSGAATGIRGTPGTAVASVAVTGAATGLKTVTGTGAGAVVVAGVSAGVRPMAGVAAASLTVGGVATGIRGTPGTATGALTVTGVAVGDHGIGGTATGSLTVAGTAAGTVTVTAVAVGTLSVAGTAAGTVTVTATASSALTVTGTASGVKSVSGTGSAAITVTSVALGLVEGNAVGVATGSLTVAGVAVGRRSTAGTAQGQLTVGGTVTGRRNVAALVTGAITLIALAVGRRGTPGTATGSITVDGTGSGYGGLPPVVTIIGEWNDVQTTALQWGALQVVDWYMLLPAVVVGVGTGGLTVAGTVTGLAGAEATATGALTVAGVAAGTVTPGGLLEPFNDYTTNSWAITGSCTIVAARTGNGARLTGTSASNLTRYTIPTATQSAYLTVGFAFRISNASGTRVMCALESDAAVTRHVFVHILTDGTVQIRLGGGAGLLLATSAAAVIPINTYVYVELQAFLHDTTGFVTMRVNGTQVAAATNIDTKNAGTKTVFDTLCLIAPASGINNTFDDLYLTMGSGAPFKGDITV